MKTFKDLEFRTHMAGNGLQGFAFFPNGYGVSVVRFKLGFYSGGTKTYGSYTNNEDEWELAVLKGNSDDWSITYNTPVTEDVLGHLSEVEVTDVMKKVQELQ